MKIAKVIHLGFGNYVYYIWERCTTNKKQLTNKNKSVMFFGTNLNQNPMVTTVQAKENTPTYWAI